MLEFEELQNLYEQVIEKIREKMFLYNRDSDEYALREYLKKIEMDDLISTTPIYETYKKGKIVIIGQSSIDKNIIYGIMKEFKIDKDRIELCVEYNDVESFNFKKLRYNPQYRVVLVGLMPHNTSGKAYHGSTISEMEQEPGYPRIFRLTASQDLKITKTRLKEAISTLIQEKYI